MSIERKKAIFGMPLWRKEVAEGFEEKFGRRIWPSLAKKIAPHKRIVRIGPNDRMTVIDSESFRGGGALYFSSGPQELTAREINQPENRGVTQYGRVVKTVFRHRPATT